MSTSTAYTLGQIIRLIWPAGAKTKYHDIMRANPLIAFGTALKTPDGRDAIARNGANSDLARLIERLPADLPTTPMSLAEQGSYWIGYEQYATAIADVSKLGPDHLRRAGEAMFGDRWQSDLARALNVNDRRVRQWLAGERRPSAGVWSDIRQLLRERSDINLSVLTEISKV